MANIWLSSRLRTVRQPPGWCGRRRRGLRRFTIGEELTANVYTCLLCIWRIMYLSWLQLKCSLIFDFRLEEEAERADRVAEIAEAEARGGRLRSYIFICTKIELVIKCQNVNIFAWTCLIVWISFLQPWTRVSCQRCCRCCRCERERGATSKLKIKK